MVSLYGFLQVNAKHGNLKLIHPSSRSYASTRSNSNIQKGKLEGKMCYLRHKLHIFIKFIQKPFSQYKSIHIILQIYIIRNLQKFTSFDLQLTFGQLLTFWSSSWPKSTDHILYPKTYFLLQFFINGHIVLFISCFHVTIKL